MTSKGDSVQEEKLKVTKLQSVPFGGFESTSFICSSISNESQLNEFNVRTGGATLPIIRILFIISLSKSTYLLSDTLTAANAIFIFLQTLRTLRTGDRQRFANAPDARRACHNVPLRTAGEGARFAQRRIAYATRRNEDETKSATNKKRNRDSSLRPRTGWRRTKGNVPGCNSTTARQQQKGRSKRRTDWPLNGTRLIAPPADRGGCGL